jgi:hypothetical protein
MDIDILLNISGYIKDNISYYSGISNFLRIDRTTLYRKLKSNNFSAKEAYLVIYYITNWKKNNFDLIRNPHNLF